MGQGQSISTLSAHEALLQQLSGPQDIEYDSQYWNQLFNLQLPLASKDPLSVQEALVPHCRQLMVHNPITHNFQKLVLHCLELINAAQNSRPSLAVANSLHMVTVMIKFIIETCSPSSLSMVFEVAPNLPQSVQGVALLATCSRRSSLWHTVQPINTVAKTSGSAASAWYSHLIRVCVVVLTFSSTKIRLAHTPCTCTNGLCGCCRATITAAAVHQQAGAAAMQLATKVGRTASACAACAVCAVSLKHMAKPAGACRGISRLLQGNQSAPAGESVGSCRGMGLAAGFEL
jgi:hypothetical protein